VATAGGRLSRIFGLLRLIFTLGPSETIRMLRNVLTGRRHQPTGVALESDWSRGAIRWGQDLAVRFLLRPDPGTKPAPVPTGHDPEYLSREAASRLAEGPIRLELCIQRYIDEKTTPIEDASVEWQVRATPPIPVAILTIPQQDVAHAVTRARSREIEGLAFNPGTRRTNFAHSAISTEPANRYAQAPAAGLRFKRRCRSQSCPGRCAGSVQDHQPLRRVV
jgi:hypothetical protein